MYESKNGVFSREKSPYVEVEAFRSDSYVSFARKAAKKIKTKV